MSITSQMRSAWAPPCTGPLVRLNLHGEGRITVRANAAPAFIALNEKLKKYNYRTRRADTGAYNCRRITGGSSYSLHAYGIAADLNWQSNPYGPRLITDMPMPMIEEIEALRTNSGHKVFRWGGRYSGNKDAMHFEVICTPQQLATGIRVEAPPLTIDMEDDVAVYMRSTEKIDSKGNITPDGDYMIVEVTATHYRKLSGPGWKVRHDLAKFAGKPIEVQNVHPWAMGKFVIDFDLIELPVA